VESYGIIFYSDLLIVGRRTEQQLKDGMTDHAQDTRFVIAL